MIRVDLIVPDSLYLCFSQTEDVLAQFPKIMADELTEWQKVDMRRQYPNTTMTDDSTAETDIWPRSREDKPKPKAQRVRTLRKRLRQVKFVNPLKISSRPILREVLWDKLVERMIVLLGMVSWGKGK